MAASGRRNISRTATGLSLAALFVIAVPGCGPRYPELVTATPKRVVVAYEPERGIPRTTRIATKACKKFGAVPEYVSADDQVVEYECVKFHISNEWDPRKRNH